MGSLCMVFCLLLIAGACVTNASAADTEVPVKGEEEVAPKECPHLKKKRELNNAGPVPSATVEACAEYGRRTATSMCQREARLAKDPARVARDVPGYFDGDDVKIGLYRTSLGVLAATAKYRDSTGYGGDCKTPNTFTHYLLSQGYISGPYRSCAPPVKCDGYDPKYRSYDGSCNNPKYMRWGMATSAFNRLLPPNYCDGVYAPRKSVHGEYLPNARMASAIMFDDHNNPDYEWTVLFMQFGQFVSHDMSHAPSASYGGEAIQCCVPGGYGPLPGHAMHHACYPITISPADPFYSQWKQGCMNFVRTMTVAHPDCRLGPAEQMNSVSHFADLSQVYGSNKMQAENLRTYSGGLLKYQFRKGRVVLPSDEVGLDGCDSACPYSACYTAGDHRVNQNLGLASLHILFLRNHNRLASDLHKVNPHWDDEYLYQEARRINIAVYQKILYYEYLPGALGWKFCAEHGLIAGEGKAYSGAAGYSDYVNPNVLNEHATAAFRYFHSSIHPESELMGPDRYVNRTTRMSNHFNCPAVLEYDHNYDYYLRGMCTSPMQKNDRFFTHEVTWFLFKEEKPYGQDLESIDIQRGRDHGLRCYNDYRELCGLPRAKNFYDLTDTISEDDVKRLEYMFSDVNDIDLVLGAFRERHVKGAQLGPTLQCIVGEQFYRTRAGDKHFFEHQGMHHSFTEEQLYEIHKVTMSSLVCLNGDYIHQMQPNAFRVLYKGNPLLPCADIPQINLGPWKTAPAY